MSDTIEAGWKALEQSLLTHLPPSIRESNAGQALFIAARQAYYVGSFDTAERLRKAFCADSEDEGGRFVETMQDAFAEVAEEMQRLPQRIGGDAP